MREWLRDLRKSKGVTLAELGEATGMSECHMSNIEAGKRKSKGLDVVTLAKIAGRLGVDLDVCFKAEAEWMKEMGLWKG